MRGGSRVTAFIGTQEGHIQAIAKVRNAVALPAEKCQRAFRRENQAQIRVALVLIKIVPAAGEEPNHGADIVRLRRAIAFELLDIGVAFPQYLGRGREVLRKALGRIVVLSCGGAFDLDRHVVHVHQHVGC